MSLSLASLLLLPIAIRSFSLAPPRSLCCETRSSCSTHPLYAGKGFGAPSAKKQTPKKKKEKKQTKSASKNTPYVKSDTDQMVQQLTESVSQSPMGQAVSSSNTDEFWDLIPVLIQSKFPKAKESDLERIAGFIRFSTNPCVENLEADIVQDEWRPHDEIHAFMPGLGSR